MEKGNAHYVAKESSTFKKIKNTIDFNFIYYFKYFNSLFLSSKKYVCLYMFSLFLALQTKFHFTFKENATLKHAMV